MKKKSRAATPHTKINNTVLIDTTENPVVDNYIALGKDCNAKKQHQHALIHYTKAVLLAPTNEQALLGCFQALFMMKRPAEAAVYSERAIALNPNQQNYALHGQALYQIGQYKEAFACFSVNPSEHANVNQRALCLTQLNRYDEAKRLYQLGISLNPNDPVIQANYALCLLALGELRAGFQAYEWRWQSQLKDRNRPWVLPSYVTELQGKSALIRTEQGLGDSLQFFRYVPLLAQQGVRVVFEVQPALIQLLSYWKNTATLIASGSPLPTCDYHFPMMSLALIFKTDLQSIPTSIPYVFSEPARTESCKQLLKQSSRKRIGIAWRGSALNTLNHKRSIALSELLTIHHPDLDFICLQNDVTHEEKALLDQHLIPYHGFELNTFEGTAALISCLDLVVTIDTSIAHLTGAMGKPVWILLPFSSDWRWLLDREDSPWYPTAKLFRQTMMDNWHPLLTRVKAELGGFVQHNPNIQINIELTLQEAAKLKQSGAFGEAEQLYFNIIAKQPNQHIALHELALSAFQQNNIPRAIELMQQTVKAAPSIPLYQRNLGELLRRVGRCDEAISAHQVAIDLEPHSAENHYHLGLALNDNQQYENAITHYRIALSLNLNHGLAWNNLGASLEKLGDLAGAKDAYTKAIKLNPNHTEAQNNLGAICCEQGYLDDARIHFAAAINSNPNFIEAHYNLSSLKTYTYEDPHLRMLESILPQIPTLPEKGRIRYYFAFGKALDDTKQHAQAFQMYAEGNRLQYAQEPWDDTSLKNLTEQIKAIFTKDFLKKPRKTKDLRTPIFILGMPRSGSTLIEQILSSHENIYGAGELATLGEIIHSAPNVIPNAPFTNWIAQLKDKEFSALGKAYLDKVWSLAPDKKYITDKMPGNFFYIGMIYRMFPGAKIIHTLRDPMDICFSCFTKLFNHNLSYAYNQEALGRYFIYYAEMMKHWHEVLPKGTILDLPYENMVADHEQQTKKILDYIGLPWDPNCLNFYKNDRLVKTASAAQVRKPIYRTSVKHWEKYTDELQPLLRILSPYRSAYLMETSL